MTIEDPKLLNLARRVKETSADRLAIELAKAALSRAPSESRRVMASFKLKDTYAPSAKGE